MKKMLTSPHRNAMNKQLNDGVSLLESDVGADGIAVQRITPRRNNGGGVHTDRFGFGLPPVLTFGPGQPRSQARTDAGSCPDMITPNTRMTMIASRTSRMSTGANPFVRLFSGSAIRQNEETSTDDDLLNISMEHLERAGSSPEGNEYTDVAPHNEPLCSLDAVWPAGESTTDPEALVANENGEAAAQTDSWCTAIREPKLQIVTKTTKPSKIMTQTSVTSVRKTAGSTTSNLGFEDLEALFRVITPIPEDDLKSPSAAARSCAECSQVGVAGSVDPDDGHFYCNSCWATFEPHVYERVSSGSKQAAVQTGRKTPKLTRSPTKAAAKSPAKSPAKSATKLTRSTTRAAGKSPAKSPIKRGSGSNPRRVLGNMNNSSVVDLSRRARKWLVSNDFWSADQQPTAKFKPRDQRNAVHAAYLAPMSAAAPSLPGFRKVKSFVKVLYACTHHANL